MGFIARRRESRSHASPPVSLSAPAPATGKWLWRKTPGRGSFIRGQRGGRPGPHIGPRIRSNPKQGAHRKRMKAFIEDTLREAGRMALALASNAKGERKADRSLVSDADRQVETYITKRITERFPDDRIIGEEHGQEKMRGDACIGFVGAEIEGSECAWIGGPETGLLLEFAQGCVLQPLAGINTAAGKGIHILRRWIGAQHQQELSIPQQH